MIRDAGDPAPRSARLAARRSGRRAVRSLRSVTEGNGHAVDLVWSCCGIRVAGPGATAGRARLGGCAAGGCTGAARRNSRQSPGRRQSGGSGLCQAQRCAAGDGVEAREDREDLCRLLSAAAGICRRVQRWPYDHPHLRGRAERISLARLPHQLRRAGKDARPYARGRRAGADRSGACRLRRSLGGEAGGRSDREDVGPLAARIDASALGPNALPRRA